MHAFRQAIQQMILITEEELDLLCEKCIVKTFKKSELLSREGTIPNDIFFITAGIVRVKITDRDGVEHTLHFATEYQFIADYSCFLQKLPSSYDLEALEETTVVVIPRNAKEWGYNNLKEGDRLGRLIAEFYFIYQDNRIKNMYYRTPAERYSTITEVFPNIHNRVPQHMIASYLGITPVHLSRLKKQLFR